jgi:hypothetical protein
VGVAVGVGVRVGVGVTVGVAVARKGKVVIALQASENASNTQRGNSFLNRDIEGNITEGKGAVNGRKNFDKAAFAC